MLDAGGNSGETARIRVARPSHLRVPMNPYHIDFISSYCDRWCERCPLAERCSAFSVTAAIAMCDGDAGAAFELALGPAPDDDGAAEPRGSWPPALFDAQMSPEDEAEWMRREEQRSEKVDASPIMLEAKAVMSAAHQWLTANADALATGDEIVREALAVVSHDVALISAKLHRALHGRHCAGGEDAFGDDHPVQNDWNGSAKVALISIERSVEAWSVLASISGQHTPACLAAQLTALRAEVERAFPDAWKFCRPGFDGHAQP